MTHLETPAECRRMADQVSLEVELIAISEARYPGYVDHRVEWCVFCGPGSVRASMSAVYSGSINHVSVTLGVAL
jgi:hypothetical protein